MYIIVLLLLITAILHNDQISAGMVEYQSCPDRCKCISTTATCMVNDATISTILQSLPRNLTTLYLEGNGNNFSIDEITFEDTPNLRILHLGRLGTTSYQILRKLRHLRELSVNSPTTCRSCNYTRVDRNQSCSEDCTLGEESPFQEEYCACANCVDTMIAPNCSQTLLTPSPLLGNSTIARVALWLTSSLALVSNLALLGSRCYGHTLRQKPLSVLIASIALSNLLITASVFALLVADVNQSSGLTIALHGTCSPIYILKHFGIHSLVLVLCIIVTQRCINLGYHRCLASEITVRRACFNIAEAWVLAFLLIILPWHQVSHWHRMCTASYDSSFANVMYFISGCLMLVCCLFSLVQVAVLFWRLVRSWKQKVHKETRMDLGLISATVFTLLLLAIPHSVTVVGQFSRIFSPEHGTEVVTILLIVLCALNPFFLIHYYPNMSCLDDSVVCTCAKCKISTTRHYCSREHHVDTQKSTVTMSSFQESFNVKVHSATVTTSASVERMSDDSLIDIEPWRTQTSKTRNWVESCDYCDLKKLQAPTKLNSFSETKAVSNNASSTSGVNDVSSLGSMVTTSERTSSFREAIHEHALLEPVPRVEATTTQKAESDSGKTSDSRASRRFGSIREFLQSTLFARRQRSKSLPEKRVVRINKFERSQSVPSGGISGGRSPQLGKTSPAFTPTEIKSNTTSGFGEFSSSQSPLSDGIDGKDFNQQINDHVDQQTSISPAKLSPDNPPLSPQKAGSGRAGKITKNFVIGRKSPSQSEPAKMMTLEEGDVLTELPAMRRQKIRPSARDPTARDSVSSIGSVRSSLEWDPIGSMEGYADREVLPPNPSGPLHVPKFPQQQNTTPPSAPVSCETLPAQRISSYSLDWDPTSVQLRNSMMSRDSLYSIESTDDTGSVCEAGDSREEVSVWV